MAVIVYNLTFGEILMAAQNGCARNVWAICHGNKPKYGQKNDKTTFADHCIGAIAEYTVAKYLNRFWPAAVGEYGRPDVGGLVEARARSCDNGRWLELPLRANDSNESPFVLVNVDLTRGREIKGHCRVELRGWILCGDGKQLVKPDDKGNGREPAWFVPEGELRPMEELKTWVHEREQPTQEAAE